MTPRGSVDAPDLGVILDRWVAEPASLDGFSAVVEAAAGASETDLNLLVANAPVWSSAVAALAASTGPIAWSGPYGELRLEIVPTDAEGPRVVRIGFEQTGVRVLVDGDAVNPAGTEVTVRLGVRSLVDLATGRADGALLYLADRLQVNGDATFLLALGATLRVPGSGTALIDPEALAPEAVSAAIKDVSTEHLDAVMAGGFRDLILDEVFRRLPEFLNAEKAARVRLTVGFLVEGPAGAGDRYLVDISDGACITGRDPDGERQADVTLVLTGAQFLRLVLGHLNPVRAVLGGQVRVQGELMKALAFNSIMRIPGI